MWNATTSDFVKQLVLSHREEYPYYVAHTISNTSGNYDVVTVRIYFSANEVKANGLYSYVVPAGSFFYDVVTSNYNDRANNSPRLSTRQFSGTLNISQYEFVYTNAVSQSYTIQPDILAERGLTNETFQGFSFVFVGVVLVAFFSAWFQRRRSSII